MTDVNTNNTVAIDRDYHWREIDTETPRGVKLQLINRAAGVALYATYNGTDKHFTHWAPLPTFRKS